MIFDIKPTPAGLTASQRQTDPAVYLDFCALREIAENAEWRARFAGALGRLEGTLLVSVFTIYEFSLLSDLRHAVAADELLERLFSRLFFFNCEPFTVIAAEDRNTNPAHPDGDLFGDTLTHLMHQGESGTFNLTATFSSRSADARQTIEEFGVNVVEAIAQLKQRLATNAEARKNANNAMRWVGQREKATKALLSCLLRPLHEGAPPKANDTIDLMHAIVPGAYAEFVVLDSRWASEVKQAAKRMHKAGLTARVAQAFSTKRGGIPAFLTALESYSARPPAAVATPD